MQLEVLRDLEQDAGDYYLSHWTVEKLILLTQNVDLTTVLRIEIKIDSRKTEMSSLGYLLPNLRQLKLNNSFVPVLRYLNFSLRDLGTGYRNLVHLFMARCHVSDLDGIGSISTLREVYLAFNKISDISDLARLEDLEILDLEGNAIADIDQIDYLSLCPNLTTFTATANPIYTIDNVRDLILQILPRLESLDDKPAIDITVTINQSARPNSAIIGTAVERKPTAPQIPSTPTFTRRCVTPTGAVRNHKGIINLDPLSSPWLVETKRSFLPSITPPTTPQPPATERKVVTNFRKRVFKTEVLSALPPPSDRPIVLLTARRATQLGRNLLEPIKMKTAIGINK